MANEKIFMKINEKRKLFGAIRMSLVTCLRKITWKRGRNQWYAIGFDEGAESQMSTAETDTWNVTVWSNPVLIQNHQ